MWGEKEEGAWGEKEEEKGDGWEGREVWEGEAVGKAGRRGGKVGGKGRGLEGEGREGEGESLTVQLSGGLTPNSVACEFQ